MIRRALLVASLAFLAVSLLSVTGVHAATTRARLPWKTCTPLATFHWGQYRVDDGGASRRLCIRTTTGHNVIVLGNYEGTGVAYPAIRTGRYYGSLDPQSRLPVQVSDPTWINLKLHSNCRAPGSWLSDVDAWFYPTSFVAGHGSDELVIANCSHAWPGLCPHVLKIRHLAFCARKYLTGGSSGWPIMVLRLIRERRTVHIPLSHVIRVLDRWGWLAPSWWLGSVFYGPELQHGAGKGLRLSATDYIHGYPRLQPPPRRKG